ncbi:DUF6233 domain-containing protein [Streptomyces sp. BE133]|uniref:DUF6233 domain-containing protein n=1 Tax=Streptomyces sp. BE133 TaxID=3002523 RepID=UPI003FA6F6B2
MERRADGWRCAADHGSRVVRPRCAGLLLAARACRTSAPTPDWGGRAGRGEGRHAIIGVHQGFCRPSGATVKTDSREQAADLLTEDSALACRLCRPDTVLGLLR